MHNLIAIFGTSAKKNENRIPLHPSLFHTIPQEVKKHLIFEKGYGRRFNINDDYFIKNFAGVAERKDLFLTSNVWVLPKPEQEDYKYFSSGKILFGWLHCVQGYEITQAAIENNMTLISWESMYGGNDNTHVFNRNNELAGYAAVQHMLMLQGINGYFGKKLKAAVLGFGATGRGSINSLKSLGINDITVFSNRPTFLIKSPIESIDYRKITHNNNDVYLEDDKKNIVEPIEVLNKFDIIINCILQNPISPITFIHNKEINKIDKRTIIIDISCDKGMGFEFARPTNFSKPFISINENINYYCIDNTPSIYWESASYEITKSLTPFLELFINNSWKDDIIIKNAIEIENGIIKNKKIIDFQKRNKDYPYKI